MSIALPNTPGWDCHAHVFDAAAAAHTRKPHSDPHEANEPEDVKRHRPTVFAHEPAG